MNVINETAPSKEIKIKSNNQDWFDTEVADLINAQVKLFLKFNKSKLPFDEEICKNVKNQIHNPIKKQDFYEIKLKQGCEGCLVFKSL